MMADTYRTTYQRLLERILAGPILLADETEVKLRAGKGYVWVFASLQEVVYMYRPTREGGFLLALLQDFHGVLVSDFYAGYDGVGHRQQKCLVHLIRDLNDDLWASPYNAEFEGFVLNSLSRFWEG